MTPDPRSSGPSTASAGLVTLPRRTAKVLVRSASRAAFRVLGTSAPTAFHLASCLVVAPHPDDETLGCGALIAGKRAAGTPVTVVVVSDGRRSPRAAGLGVPDFVALRRAEARQALSRLGVAAADVVFLDFEDGTLDQRAAEVAAALTQVLRTRAPEQVLVTSTADRHPDHAAVGRIARSLLDRGEIAGELYEYPVWQRVPAVTTTVAGLHSWLGRLRSVGPAAAAARLRPLLVRTGEHLDIKRLALAAYPSQLPYLPLGFVEDFLQPFEVLVPVVRRAGRTAPLS